MSINPSSNDRSHDLRVHNGIRDNQHHVAFSNDAHERRSHNLDHRSVTSENSTSRSRDRLLDYIHDKFPSRIIRRVLKCSIAYVISMLISLIRPISVPLGTNVFLATTGMIFSHPARSMGAQFDATVTSILGVCLAILWAIAALAASVAYNTQHLDTYLETPVGTTANAIFLFVGVFLVQMLRQSYPKFHFFALQFMIIQIFSMTRGTNLLAIDYELPAKCGAALLIGTGISLVVNLVLWPETAVDGMGRALDETLSSSSDMMRLITGQLFLKSHPQGKDSVTQIDQTASKMRKGMIKVKASYREAKYELSYAYVRPQELGVLRKPMGRLTRYLSILGDCLKNEQELFESIMKALRDEIDEQSESEGPDDTETIDDGASSKRTSMLAMSAGNIAHAASAAAEDYARTGHYHSPRSSRANSRRSSWEEDIMEQNQKSVTSLRSFLGKFSSPKPKIPPKYKKHIKQDDRYLLITYLENLREPLRKLSIECACVLECLRNSMASELDLDDDRDHINQSNWIRYLLNLLRLQKSSVSFNDNIKLGKARHSPQNCNCATTIRSALSDFDLAENERMKFLYKAHESRLSNNKELDHDLQNELFLIFFIIFTFCEAANELEIMANNMDILRRSHPDGPKRKHLYMPQLSQKWWLKWSKWSNYQSMRDKGGYAFVSIKQYIPKEERENEAEEEYRLTRIQTSNSLRRQRTRRSSSVTAYSSAAPNTLTQTYSRLRSPTSQTEKLDSLDSNDIDVEAPRVADISDARDKLPLQLRIRYAIWKKFTYLNHYEFKFAFKFALAVTVLCIPAFVPSSMGWYLNWKCQWVPMTVIAIMNPTSGGTIQASFWRIVGTLIGAFIAWAALEAGGQGGSGNPYLLALFGCLLAIPAFYIHLSTTYNKVGMVTLITYMVVALTRYTNPDPNFSIAVTVWQRTAAMIVGIFVALLLNSLIWPFVARHAVRKTISGVLYELGDYYAYVISTFVYHDPQPVISLEDIKRGTKIESKIQASIVASTVLLELTDHEPRFKGPFPKEFYKEMIVSTQNLLDRLHILRISSTKMPMDLKTRAFHFDCQESRRDMIASILLHFYTLSLSLRTKTPLPAYMPSSRLALDRDITNCQEHVGAKQWISTRNITWFAMSCSTEEVIEELEHLADLVRYIVGESKFAEKAKTISNFNKYFN